MDEDRRVERSRLDLVVGSVMRVVASENGDTISSLPVGLAVEELLGLDPVRPGSWRLRGMAEGYGMVEDTRAASTEALERIRIAGVLDAAASAGDRQRVVSEALAHASLTEALVATGDLEEIALVLEAIFAERPRWAIDLLAMAPHSFPLWDRLAAAVLAHADGRHNGVSRGDGVALLAGLRATLERWAATEPLAAPAIRRTLRQIREGQRL